MQDRISRYEQGIWDYGIDHDDIFRMDFGVDIRLCGRRNNGVGFGGGGWRSQCLRSGELYVGMADA
jgi:hypothetical protein